MRTFALKTLLFWTVVCVGLAGSFPLTASAQGSSVAPTLIPVGGSLLTAGGQPRTGTVSLVVSLYDGQNDTAPRWVEQQNVTLDAAGGYSVQFGATLADGLPGDLFLAGGGTRWLGVAERTEAGDVEQPRVMLVSVPYAAKAASAETLGGKSASDFVLNSTFREDLRTVLEEEGVTGDDVGTAGALNVIQKGSGGAGITDATNFVEVSGNVGIGTATPNNRLDVAGGGVSVRGSVAALSNANALHFDNAGGDSRFMAVGANASTLGTFSFVQSGTGASGFNTAMRILGGNVGIGTTSPVSKLDVNQSAAGATALYIGMPLNAVTTAPSIRVRGYSPSIELLDKDAVQNWYLGIDDNDGNKLKIGRGYGPNQGFFSLSVDSNDQVLFSGNVTVNGNIGAKYQDVAEWVDSDEALEAGSLVVIDTTATNRVSSARKAYDSKVAGAVSPQPGLILGEPGPGKLLVAQSGRVKIKADARNGAIKPGDLLVSSPTPGHVMRSRPVKVGDQWVHRSGTVVGKALEALPKGKGQILVLLTLQ